MKDLNSIGNGAVLVVGDVMLDRYWKGDCNRISPESPVPVVNVNNVEDRAGGAANVALNIKEYNTKTRLMSVVGNDNEGLELKALIESKNVNCDFVVEENIPTITKLRVLSRNQQLIRLDFEESNFSGSNELLEQFRNRIEDVDVIVLSDYAKGCLSHVEKLIAFANEKGKTVLIDPKGKDFSKYKGATLLTPNFSEFETVVGKCESEEQIKQRALELIKNLSLDALLVTRSENGMSLFKRNGEVFHIPALAKDVYDVTGAGDTVIGTIAACLAANMPIEEAINVANVAASIVVGKMGTATVSLSELNSALKPMVGHDLLKSNGFESVKSEILQAQSENKRVVFTNGCFDIIHPGHVKYLAEAKREGDFLVVALNSDDSVRRLKGDGRPVNDLQHRIDVIAGLKSVDWVVFFEEDTPLEIIDYLRPDVLVKGGDYNLDEIIGAELVQSYGGKVKALNFEDGFSTTNIINSIQKLSEKG